MVVDNDSTDGTLTAARKIAAVNPELVRVERETEIQGTYAARNTGIRESSGGDTEFGQRVAASGQERTQAVPDHGDTKSHATVGPLARPFPL
ncbi:glycosyltransferase family A protein [Halomontanus rarus]|uniref:glycosyltransferase family A protein n=1 Tax=Halomontanus rarus TaxID=3034020 RepID=UPI0023E75B23|nr:glycosyltransferase family A protein [Halovivax sp. TS33]